jgi:hypothetical protein
MLGVAADAAVQENPRVGFCDQRFQDRGRKYDAFLGPHRLADREDDGFVFSAIEERPDEESNHGLVPEPVGKFAQGPEIHQ